MIYHTNLGLVDVVTPVIDYIDSDGETHVDHPTKEILITDESDLETLVDYPVGSIAYTAGLTKMYILDADGDWIIVGSETAVEFDSNEGGE